MQEYDLAQRQQAPERQLAALAELRKAPGDGAANLLRAAHICEGAAGLFNGNMCAKAEVFVKC